VALEIVLAVAVLGLVIYRQVIARPVNARGLRLIVILAVIGVIETVNYLQKYHAGPGTYAALGGSLVLAAVFGVLRAGTVRIWSQDGQVWSKGNWLTAALWIVAIAVHLGYDALVAHGHGNDGGGVGAATIVLYLAVSLGVQRVVAQFRASRMGLAPLDPTGSGPMPLA
jgi:FtsH-binding integral membrane protein